MLDLDLLSHLRLSPRPWLQRVLSYVVHLNYVFSRIKIEIEGEERIPRDIPVIFAMNHTDRYNYLPLQHHMDWSGGYRYTAAWTKGKYYENPLVAWVLEAAAQLPVPSRGFLYSKDFKLVIGRLPTDEEYETIRQWRTDPEQSIAPDPQQPALKRLWETPRDILGRRFSPTEWRYPVFMEALFEEMMGRFVALNRQALFEKRLNVIIFPEGTRTVRLTRGHIGLAEVAMHLGVPIVPVACNGNHRLYPGDLPWARHGRVVYRVGEPMTWEGELAPYRLSEPFRPFSLEAEERHRETFQAVVDRVMARIEGMLDPEHRPGAEETILEHGAKRFL